MTESTRNRIILNSLCFFVEKGFKEAKVDDLADHIGIAKKTIYNHFDSKQELLFASVEHDINVTIEKVETLMSNDSLSYANRLGILFFLAYYKIEERKKLFPDVVSLYKPPGKIMQRLVKNIQTELLKTITKLITNGINARHFRSDLHIEITSSMIISMLIGIPNFNLNANTPTNPNQLILESIKIVIRGITTDLGNQAFDEKSIEPYYKQIFS